MKASKRLFSILMVLAMLAGLMVPAVATGTTRQVTGVRMDDIGLIPGSGADFA